MLKLLTFPRALRGGLFVSIAIAFTFAPCVQATEVVDFSWKGAAGYSATGSFLFDPATAPVSFSEAPGAVGPTKYLQYFAVAFFDPSGILLEVGSSILNGVTSDRFFRLDYNSATRAVSALDADIGGSNYQYFLTDLRTSAGMVVPPGMTDFNFFYRPGSTPILDSASAVQITSVTQTPELATVFSASLAILIVGAVRRHSRSAAVR